MHTDKSHISVCVCTYKRITRLARLVAELCGQDTGGLFTYSVVVVDNDSSRSAEKTVEDLRRRLPIDIYYHNESEQNIALARNRAVANAKGEFLAFIDDDEVPCKTWLVTLYNAYYEFRADGVLGPVVPCFEVDPPKWVTRGRFFERPTHRTGEILHWKNTRTGNVLLRRGIFDDIRNQFGREFGGGGEDTDFFKRMIAKGFRFVWSAEAPVYEAVTAERCTRTFLLKRALLRGRQPQFSFFDFAKSVIAVGLYTASLPFFFAAGHDLFMKYLIKDCDHFGRLLALCGIDLLKQRYISTQ